jgi:hypothetical protein
MRTTLTLDDDVAIELEAMRREHGYRLKEAVNLVLRQGLASLRQPPARRSVYRTPSVDLGTPRLPSLDNITEVLSLAEGDGHG